MPNLIFKTLTLKNFGSYLGSQTIELDRGPCLIYITGQNKLEPTLGSNDIGKSTLINALYWCLTGKTLRSSRPGQAIEPWTNTNTVTGSLDFLKDNIYHNIVRTRRPNNLLLDSETVTQDRITEVLGLSDEAIPYTLIVGQFNGLFLDLDPATQSRLFTELLNLDVWPKAVKVCSNESQTAEINIRKAEQQISRIEGSLTTIKEQLETSEQSAADFAGAKAKELIELRIKLDTAIKTAVASTTKLSIQDQQLKQLPNIDGQEGIIKELRNKQAESQSAISTSETIKARNQRELGEVEERLEEYRTADNYCPACGQEVSKDHIDEKVAGYTIRRNRLLDALEANEQTLRRNNKVLHEINQEINAFERGLAEIRETIQTSTQQYNSALLKANDDQRISDQIHKDIDKLTESNNPFTAVVSNLRDRRKSLQIELVQHEKTFRYQHKVLELCKLWDKGYKEIRLNLIDETLEELEFTVNNHITRLGLVDWEIGFHTERETTKGDVVHKFTANLFPPRRDHPVARESLGGGVTTRLQLGSFFGLSEILLARAGIVPNIEFLDEPCRHLSQEGIDDLLESLRGRALETGRTIYFVDHQRLDNGLFDQVLWIEKDANGSRIIAD